MDIRQTLLENTFYHGALEAVGYPKVEKENPFSDLGRAFYVTGNHWQAKEWGRKKAMEANWPTFAVSEYSFTNINGLRIRIFDRPDEFWLRAVLMGRMEGKSLPFDIVVGPVADGAIIRTLIEYERALQRLSKIDDSRRLEEATLYAIEGLKVKQGYDQYALLSEKATQKLLFKGADIYDRWTGNLEKRLPGEIVREERKRVLKAKVRED